MPFATPKSQPFAAPGRAPEGQMSMRGLYAIVDVTTLSRRRLSVLDVAGAIASARPAALQLRAKDLAPRETLQLLRAIHPLCREAGVPLFANDRPDLAMLAGCEGVHVGQEDLPVHVVRRIAPMLRVGVSTHTLSEVDRALADKPDYLAFGPVFETRSKAKPDDIVGIDGLMAVAARCPVPVVAIGGIDLDRARDIARATHLGAVIAALVPEGVESNDLAPITERARALHAALAS
jgi:thiamine-phosphate pyrophosphorylase